jgi:two-component sensor histidine kinase
MNFHTQFEEISKLKVNSSDTLDDVLYRIGEKLAICLNLERVNVWGFKNKPNRIECIGNYCHLKKSFSKGQSLFEKDIPSYFSHLKSDKAIRIKNVKSNEITKELKDTYCKDFGIQSIMDIPFRIEGKLAGVICFEDLKNERDWTDNEVNFALAVSQIVSLSIENQKRKNYEKKLEKALEEKNTLLAEMHHRLKNNLTLLVSLLRVQTGNIQDQKALNLIENFENQILSISKLHEQLYITDNYLRVDLSSYLNNILENFKSSNRKINFNTKFESITINSNIAVPIGLIINEIINNSIKYAQGKSEVLEINLACKKQEKTFSISIQDNGKGFDLEKGKNNSFGLSLIYDLSEQIDAKIDFTSNQNGTEYKLKLTI